MSSSREIKAGFGYTIGNILIKGVSFFSLPIFTRLLNTEEFGIYNNYLAYESIVTVLLGMGIYASIKNAKYDFPGEMDLYFSSLLRIVICSLTTFIIIILMMGNSITRVSNLTIPVLFILVFHSTGTVTLGLYNAKLSLNYNYKNYLVVSFFNTIANILFSILLIQTFFYEKKEIGRILGTAIPLILLTIYILISEGRKAKFKAKKCMIKYALIIGLPLIWHLLSQTIESQIDRIMITKYIGSSATGIYSFIYSIVIIFQIIFNSTDTVWSVWLFEQMDKKRYEDIKRVLSKYLILITVVAVCMASISNEIIKVMSDESYWVGDRLFFPILIGLFFMFLYTIPASIEYYYKETGYIAVGTAVAAMINIITNYIFIQRYGYIIAAYTTLLSYFITFVIHYFISMKLLKKNSISNIIPLRLFFLPTILLIGICIFDYFYKDNLLMRLIALFVILCMIISLYHKDIRMIIISLLQKEL